MLRFSLGSQVQNLFSCTDRGSKADGGRVPSLDGFENKNPRCQPLFFPTVQDGERPYSSRALAKSDFFFHWIHTTIELGWGRTSL